MSVRYLRLGNTISLIAGVLILLVLLGIMIHGIQAVFYLWVLVVMWMLWVMGIAAYVSYVLAALKIRQLMKYAGVLALIVTLMGLILLTEHKMLGAELIVLGYFLEPIAGVSLYLRLLDFNKPAAHVFFWGAVIFTVGLPLILIKNTYISLIGDLIKTIGLIILILKD
ncbi:hypothetical protein [Caldivirga maquilingensis]|uniref:Uncharacterized protein n=1 Tax=Caldivirga maquilingensis (strain ATCC 700844 / DSM 13496 / JCM 10307 / IC-167) TaxID=397948 RepID=A8MCQ8_CALMQ|nr:hypothetical protein [Caldivirga maquilingensis]ABW01564.1 conserved hypothetical protein [Caldivirga maquilingensis IC-167]